jgi:hypothetical protein
MQHLATLRPCTGVHPIHYQLPHAGHGRRRECKGEKPRPLLRDGVSSAPSRLYVVAPGPPGAGRVGRFISGAHQTVTWASDRPRPTGPSDAPIEALSEGLRGRCGYAAAAGCNGLRQASPAARAELTYHTRCPSRHMQHPATLRPCSQCIRATISCRTPTSGGGVGGVGTGKKPRPS